MEWPYRIPYPHGALQFRLKPTPIVLGSGSLDTAMHHLRAGRTLRCCLCRCRGSKGYDWGRAFKIQDGLFYHQNDGVWEESKSGTPPEAVIKRWFETGHEFEVE